MRDLYNGQVGGTGHSKSCASCLTYVRGEWLYDDHGERYFCDYDCFLEWVLENHEHVADYYADLNLHNEED